MKASKQHQKKTYGVITLLLLLALTIACTADYASAKKVVKAKSVSMTNAVSNTITVEKGKTFTIQTKILPIKTTNKKITWVSSNKAIVKVNASGKITGIKKGSAKVTAKLKSNSSIVAKLTVRVGTRAKKVTINKKKSKMVEGESYTLKTTVSPSNTSNKGLVYTSSNKKVATITNGKIKAIKKGKTTITVQTKDGSKKKTSFTLNVLTGVATIKVTKSVALSVGKSKSIAYKIMPTNAVNKSVSFSTSNSKVATVSSKGIIKGKATGTAKIYVKSKDGSNRKSTVTVSITQQVTSIMISANTQHMLVGDTEKISVLFTPSNAVNKAVYYSYSAGNIASVDAKGNIKALAPGTVTITAKTLDGSNKSASVTYVIKKRTDVVLNGQQFIAHRGLSSAEPQNTLPAFAAAAEYPIFMGVETDVYETKDGQFVLMHNTTVDATTNGTGAIKDKTLAQLLKLKVNYGVNIGKYTNLKIPTLKEYLVICKAYNVMPVLHIKTISSASCEKLLNLLTEMDMINTTIITGSKNYMLQFRALSSSVQLYWMCYMTNSGIDFAKLHNFQINTEYTYVTEDRVIYAHQQGLKVAVWTVNNKDTVRKYINKGVDYITTDNRMVDKGTLKVPTLPIPIFEPVLTPTQP